MEPEKPKKPFGRRLKDFGVLKSGERKLLHACEKGWLANLGDVVPEAATDEKCVRADFLRFLLLGGDEQAPVHESGVQLKGAYIEDILNLKNCNVPFSIFLEKCFFLEQINFQETKINGSFCLNGSCLKSSLIANHMKCAFNLSLRDGLKAVGDVELIGAEIGGNLSFTGGSFENLNADGINVVGDVNFRKDFVAKGAVRLLGAQIGGDLSCMGGHFEFAKGNAFSADRMSVVGGVSIGEGFLAKGVVRMAGAKIGGSLDCAGGHFESEKEDALFAIRINVEGSVSFRESFVAKGAVNLSGAKIQGNLSFTGGRFASLYRAGINFEGAVVVGSCFLRHFPYRVYINAAYADIGVLVDGDVWAKGARLDGLRYRALAAETSANGNWRVNEWLLQQDNQDLKSEKFCPQPWHQLQRVLREIGHVEDSKLVGIAYQKHLRKIGHVGQSVFGENPMVAYWRRLIARSLHCGFGLLAAYGYRPIRLLTWMLAVWLVCGAAYWHLSLAPYRAIAPSAPLIFQDANYINCQPDQPGPPQPPANWYLCDELRSEYATFSPLAYSLDLMLPVVDLGQEKAWGAFIPAANAVWWKELFTHWAPGHVVRLITWFQILFGWVSSLLLVAIISGFSRRNDES